MILILLIVSSVIVAVSSIFVMGAAITITAIKEVYDEIRGI